MEHFFSAAVKKQTCVPLVWVHILEVLYGKSTCHTNHQRTDLYYPPHRCRGRYQHQATDVFSDIEDALPL